MKPEPQTGLETVEELQFAWRPFTLLSNEAVKVPRSIYREP